MSHGEINMGILNENLLSIVDVLFDVTCTLYVFSKPSYAPQLEYFAKFFICRQFI